MRDVQVLLEVVPQRHVDERTAGRDQLHGRREPALHDRDVAGGEMQVQVGHETGHLETVVAGERTRVDPGAGNENHP